MEPQCELYVSYLTFYVHVKTILVLSQPFDDLIRLFLGIIEDDYKKPNLIRFRYDRGC